MSAAHKLYVKVQVEPAAPWYRLDSDTRDLGAALKLYFGNEGELEGIGLDEVASYLCRIMATDARKRPAKVARVRKLIAAGLLVESEHGVRLLYSQDDWLRHGPHLRLVTSPAPASDAHATATRRAPDRHSTGTRQAYDSQPELSTGIYSIPPSQIDRKIGIKERAPEPAGSGHAGAPGPIGETSDHVPAASAPLPAPEPPAQEPLGKEGVEPLELELTPPPEPLPPPRPKKPAPPKKARQANPHFDAVRGAYVTRYAEFYGEEPLSVNGGLVQRVATWAARQGEAAFDERLHVSLRGFFGDEFATRCGHALHQWAASPERYLAIGSGRVKPLAKTRQAEPQLQKLGSSSSTSTSYHPAPAYRMPPDPNAEVGHIIPLPPELLWK